MIASGCRRMSRLEIIYSTTANAIRLIHRLGNEELILKELLHYLNPDDHNSMICHCKSDDVAPRLERALREAAQAKAIMVDDTWHEFQKYQLLIRVLAEQSRMDGSGGPVATDRKEITSSSPQNPSDSNTSYRYKAGR